jgi:4'-phosphopantetheinyl transferase EntD
MTGRSSERRHVNQALRNLAPPGARVATVEVAHTPSDGLSPDRCARVAARRGEFDAGRKAAATALGDLGRVGGPVGRGRRGEPLWPFGIVGSISHSGGLAVAVVSDRTAATASLGVDIELADGLDRASWDAVLTPSEQLRCSSDPRVLPTVHFAAKEAAFKAMFPLVGHELEMTGAELVMDRSGAATIRLVDGLPAWTRAFERWTVSVRWHSVPGFVVSISTVTPA